MAVLVIGLLASAALTLVAAAQYRNNEQRLLKLRVKEVGSVLTEALPSVQTPLASAAALADATGGDKAKFERFMAPYVGLAAGHPFISASLWPLGSTRPLAVVGGPPALAQSAQTTRTLLARSAATPTLAVIGIRRPALERLGYAFSTAQPGARYVAYGEAALPPNRRSPIQRNAAFSDLDYALYLGASERNADLLLTSLSHLPVQGRQAVERIRFGDTFFTVMVTPRQSLGGSLPQRLPAIIALVGALLTVGAVLLTVRLTQRQLRAEHLATRLEEALTENQRLYAEQRTIAQTLQHALLPAELPELTGAQASARYEPGERGVEIGGDWYDVIPLEGDRLLMVVGDVSGRGLAAASTMASLRYAIHAYAAQGDRPAVILDKLTKLLSIATAGRLATVLCALIDVEGHEVTVASAGHLPPLLVDGRGGEYLTPPVGPPIGVGDGVPYQSTTAAVPPAATLLAFTDGLVERRGENLDRGLERLRAAAVNGQAELPDLLDRLLGEVRHAPSEDDTAIVGLRWKD